MSIKKIENFCFSVNFTDIFWVTFLKKLLIRKFDFSVLQNSKVREIQQEWERVKTNYLHIFYVEFSFIIFHLGFGMEAKEK